MTKFKVGNNLQNHIDDIMDWFDFDRVHKVMVALDWKWVNAEEGVPNQAELRQQVRRLMKDCYHKAHYGSDVIYGLGTGGFEVEYNKEGDYFEVRFIATRWESLGEGGVPF